MGYNSPENCDITLELKGSVNMGNASIHIMGCNFVAKGDVNVF
jgi:hypothetical protein